MAIRADIESTVGAESISALFKSMEWPNMESVEWPNMESVIRADIELAQKKFMSPGNLFG